ncbi:MAG: hypothetical protein CME36_00730 [unclassified Hahellaceae]|nr:hypothetical protein [Hahellaceae bacterium]
MPYTKDSWRRRYSERSDLSTSLIHLTKPRPKLGVVDVMFRILKERTIRGSSTENGFINGECTAVCFQDAPVHAVSQNCWFEQKLRETNEQTKRRYVPSGFLFHKQEIYIKGGRPAIYDKTTEAKQYLPKSEWWRIVNFDISNDEAFIDWTHEREWRIKGDFKFQLQDVTLLFSTSSTYKKFIKLCDENDKPFYKKVAGVIVTEQILF